jgi:hypothetical protein
MEEKMAVTEHDISSGFERGSLLLLPGNISSPGVVTHFNVVAHIASMSNQTHFELGATDLLSVLQIQGRWIAARIALLRIQNARLAQRINLHLALGGSFEAAPET